MTHFSTWVILLTAKIPGRFEGRKYITPESAQKEREPARKSHLLLQLSRSPHSISSYNYRPKREPETCIFKTELQSRDESCSTDNDYNTETEASLTVFLCIQAKIIFVLGFAVKMCHISRVIITKSTFIFKARASETDITPN